MNTLIKISLLFILSSLISFQLQGQGAIVKPGGFMIIHSGYVRISQNLINDGTYNDSNGTLILSGGTQSVAGNHPTKLNNLIISSGSNTTIGTAGQTLKGVLTSNGTLNAGGNLTLVSTSAQTALVSGAGTGTVLGNVTMQRYLASGFGYKYFSSPFQAATVNEFAGEVDLGAAFPTFYSYEENSDTTWWINYTTTTNVLYPMSGYAVNFGSDKAAKTVDMSGVVSNGPLSINLYNHNKSHTKGFTLVGNPYPSPIDWNASTGWTRTNVDNAIYYFNAGSTNEYVGSYSTYINGVSSDGIANNIIPAMQGFFVHVTDMGTYPVTGSLGFSNAVRINTINPIFHKSVMRDDVFLIRISAGLADMQTSVDPLVVMFDPDAMNGFNEQMDAVKLMNTHPEIPSFYLVSPAGGKYAIKALPVPTDSLTVIPLGITLLQQGIVEFSALNIDRQLTGMQVYFSDNKHNAVVALHPGASYQVSLDEGRCDDRFSLLLSKKPLQTNSGSGNDLAVYYSKGKLYVYLDLINGESADLRVTDILGRCLHQENVSGIGYYPVELTVTDAVYIVSLRSEHNFASKKLIILAK